MGDPVLGRNSSIRSRRNPRARKASQNLPLPRMAPLPSAANEYHWGRPRVTGPLSPVSVTRSEDAFGASRSAGGERAPYPATIAMAARPTAPAGSKKCAAWEALPMGRRYPATARPDEVHRRQSAVPSGDISSVSVVIPNYNGRNLLETCLASLEAEETAVDAGVIVVDNGSSDGSVEWLMEDRPDIGVVALDSNRGFARACNLGAAIADGDIVIFLNNDATVRPGWCRALAVGLQTRPDVVIAGGLTLFTDRPAVVNSAGTRLALSAAGTDIGFGERVDGRFRRPGFVAGVSGVSMAVRRDWFLDTGGFDEDMFMFGEDVDLCTRAWIEGRRVVYTPDSVVLHAFGGTAGDRHSAVRNWYGSRNRILAATKAFEGPAAPLAVVLSVLHDLAVVGHLLAMGKRQLALEAASGKARGTIAGIREIPRSLRKRQALASRRKRSLRDLWTLGVVDGPVASLREFTRFRRLH
jgi:GT2 family glycosyltransferase